MSNEEIRQRIQYLIEHGGVWDDPLGDLRRQVRWALGISLVTLLLVALLHA